MQAFAEPSPVRLLVAAPPYLFSAAEHGLVRWELDSGHNLQLSAEHGLPGNRVEAMSFDASRGWLWVATDGGITRYDVIGGTFTELRAPQSSLGLDSLAGSSLAAAADGGLWLGHKNGLFYTSAEGEWDEPYLNEAISAVTSARDGALWIAAESGLYARRPDGRRVHYDHRSCVLDRVRFIAPTPSGGPMIVGDNSAGEQRILLVAGDQCRSYRASPNEPWRGAALRRDELVVLTARGLYSARTQGGAGARSLSREGMRLLPAANPAGTTAPRSPYGFEPVGADLPRGSRCIAATGDELFVGTQHLGTARLQYAGEESRLGWLRQSALVAGARALSVACSDSDDCYVATGAPAVWHFTGDGFRRESALGSYTLAFARSPGGDLYAVARSGDEQAIELHRNAGDGWRRVRRLSISVPGDAPELSFARFAPGGDLWLGLRYRDESGHLQPYGLAVITFRSDRGSGKVIYHRAAGHRAGGGRDVTAEGWPVPLDASDASFIDDDEVWLAASDGAVQIRDGEVKVHTEPEGAEGDLVRGVAVSSGGIVFAATRSGVAAYNGERWTFPVPLRRRVADVDVDREGRLWMASNRGVAMFDGSRIHRLDTHRGLLQNQIDELAVDHFGRVWARGSQGLVLITP